MFSAQGGLGRECLAYIIRSGHFSGICLTVSISSAWLSLMDCEVRAVLTLDDSINLLPYVGHCFRQLCWAILLLPAVLLYLIFQNSFCICGFVLFSDVVITFSDYKEKIGFTGQLLIEPKPKEPTKHQYDYGRCGTI